MPEEFIAKEDLHCEATKKKSLEVDEVDKDNNTVCTLNLPPDVVHANAGQNVTPHNPSLGLFLYHFFHTMSL